MKGWMPGAEAIDSGSSFLLLAREFMRGKGGHQLRGRDKCRDQWKDRRVSLRFVYTPVFAVS